MKELEKTKRISIATTLFILAVLIGFLTYERPKNTYTLNTKSTLEELTTTDYFTSLDNINDKNLALIDIRSQYEYEKGHLENAINIASSDIFDEENQSILNELKDSNKTFVVYGSSPEEANIPFLILYQLGYNNLKLLPVTLSYSQNKLITTPSNVEKQQQDIKSFIEESIKNSKQTPEPAVVKPVVQPVKKPVILEEKKKKRAPEGGC